MALPWIIGAAVVGIAGAVAKSISDDREEEERRARRRREEERARLEKEQAEKREAEARRAREIEKQRQEAAQKAKEEAILNGLNSLCNEYGVNSFDSRIISIIKNIGVDDAKRQILEIWDEKQDQQKIEDLTNKLHGLRKFQLGL